jgi:hypothetical protein
MMKIVISTATTLMAAVLLVACNGTTGNNDGTGVVAKSVCTSSANWNALGLASSLSEVRGVLGQPTEIVVTTESTVYTYDNCRGFVTAVDATTGATTGTDVGGNVVWTAQKGVTQINSPKRITEAIVCELDYYTFPKGSAREVCRTQANPF